MAFGLKSGNAEIMNDTKGKTFKPRIIAVGVLFAIGAVASDYKSDKRIEARLAFTKQQLDTAKESLKDVQGEKRKLQIVVSEKDLKIAQIEGEMSQLKRELKTAETQVRALSENLEKRSEP